MKNVKTLYLIRENRKMEKRIRILEDFLSMETHFTKKWIIEKFHEDKKFFNSELKISFKDYLNFEKYNNLKNLHYAR